MMLLKSGYLVMMLLAAGGRPEKTAKRRSGCPPSGKGAEPADLFPPAPEDRRENNAFDQRFRAVFALVPT